MRTVLKALFVAVGMCSCAIANAAVIYNNDFSTSATGFFGDSTITVSPNGEHFLGVLTQGSFTDLEINTVDLSALTLSFDLYAILSLDGDTVINEDNFLVGPDYFELSVVDGPILLSRTYSNYPSDTAAYAGAAARGTLGYQYFPGYSGAATDSKFHYEFSIIPTAGTTTIRFRGLSNQPATDEGFGIDNVMVASTAVPEPSVWASLILGFAILSFQCRRLVRGSATAIRNRPAYKV